MMGFWAARTGRERLLIVGQALVCATYAIVAGIWQPLQRHRDMLVNDIVGYTRTSTALSDAAASGTTFTIPADDRPLPTIITDTAAAYQLMIRRLQPTTNAAEIALEDATFESVLLWVDALEREHNLRIVALTMIRRPEPGLVAATLTIGR